MRRNLPLAALAAIAALTAVATADPLRCGGVLSGKVLQAEQQTATCEWPFDAQRAAIRCDVPMSVIARIEGVDYGLNGMATMRGAADLAPVWLRSTHGARVNIGPWIQSGLALCD